MRRLFPKKDPTPSPGTYNLSSAFDKSKNKGKTFGISREGSSKRYKNKVNLLNSTTPGPGAYNITIETGKDSFKYTLRPKTANYGI